MAFQQCIERKLSSDLIDGMRTDELMESFNKKYRQNKEQLNLSDMRAEMKAADEVVEKFEFHEIQKKRQKLLQAQVNVERLQDVLGYRDAFGMKNPGLALTNLADFDPQGKMKGPNISKKKDSYVLRYQNAFFEEIEKVSTRKEVKKTHMEDVVRALKGENTGEVPEAVASGFQKASDVAFNEARILGSSITEREDWDLPNFMFEWQKLRGNKEEWKADLREHLDIERVNEVLSKESQREDLEYHLDSIYDNIISEGRLKGSEEGSQRSGILADNMTEKRIFQWKSAESWLEMQEKYGKGTIFESLVGYLNSMARDNAILSVLGPNPKATIRTLKDKAAKLATKMRKDEKTNTRFLGIYEDDPLETYRSFESQFDEMWERIKKGTNPNDEVFADIADGLRNTMTASFLGGTQITALTDIGFSAAAAKYNGLNSTKLFLRQMKNMVPELSKNDYKLARRSRLIVDSANALGLHDARHMGYIKGAGRWMADSVLKYTHLNRWTRRMRMSHNLEYMGKLADLSGKSWEELDFEPTSKAFKESLERAGLTKREWNGAVKGSNLSKQEGIDFLKPHKDLRTDKLPKKQVREAGLKIHEAILTEQEYAVPSATLRSRTSLNFNTENKLMGKLVELGTQFKSFPITIHQTHITRQMTRKNSFKGALGLGGLMLGTTLIAGFGQALDVMITDGADPLDYAKEKPAEFFLRSLSRSGSLGIVGDAIFDTANSWTHNPIELASGPVFGFAANTMDLGIEGTRYGLNKAGLETGETEFGKKITDFAKRFAPGGNIWVTELAVKRILFDTMQKWLDPESTKHFREDKEYREEQKGQDLWWDRGELTPKRRPHFTK